MQKTIAKLFGFLVAIVGGSSASHGVVILADDFDDRVLVNATRTATITSWDTVDGIDTPATSLVFVGNGEDDGGAADLLFHDRAGEIGVDYNLSLEGTWTTVIEDVALSVGTATISLTSLRLDMNATTNSGGNQSSARNLQLEVGVVGSSSGSLGSELVSISVPSGATSSTFDVDLTSLSSVLNAAETYDFILNVSSTFTSGVNASIDNLEINGDITLVPEPSGLGLLLLGGVALLRRRR